MLARRPATPNRSFGFKRAEILAALFNAVSLIVIARDRLRRGRPPVRRSARRARRLADRRRERRPARERDRGRGGLPARRRGHQPPCRLHPPRRRRARLDRGHRHRHRHRHDGLALRGPGHGRPDRHLPHRQLLGRAAGVGARAARVDAARASTRRRSDGRSPGNPGVVEVHDLHVWQITSGFPCLSAHVLVREGDDCHGIRRASEHLLRERFAITHTTLQVDHEHVDTLLTISPRGTAVTDDERADQPARDALRRPPALGDRVARLAVERPGRTAREQDRVARRGGLRRRGLDRTQRRAEAARHRRGQARSSARSHRTSGASCAIASSRSTGSWPGSPRRCGSSASACRRSRPAPRRSSASSRRSGAARRSACAGSTTVSELAPERLRPLLRGALGEPYVYLAETSSTQDVLRDGDYPHGAVCVAEHQTAGRGRSGRRWDDAPGGGAPLLGAAASRRRGAPLPQLSLVAGLAVAAAVERGGRRPAPC